MKFRVFWDVAPCSHDEVDRRFRGAYCFHHQGDAHFNVAIWCYIPEDSKLKTQSYLEFPHTECHCTHKRERTRNLYNL
jgi:hypothetical protein